MSVSILTGDCIDLLATLPADSINTCVTSPPYYGLRDYGVAGQIGLERTPELFIHRMVLVFEEVKRVLRPDGTIWVNMGDSYASNAGGYDATGSRGATSSKRISAGTMAAVVKNRARIPASGLKPKDMMGMPWRLAFALQNAGWFLRCDIIWHKPNPMPESVNDRPTKSHEYIFLLSKSESYFYDAAAIREQVTGGAHARGHGVNPKAKHPAGWAIGPSDHSAAAHQQEKNHPKTAGENSRMNVDRDPRHLRTARKSKQNASFSAHISGDCVTSRNKRSVWTVATAPYRDAHFATFPAALIRPCILAGCPLGGTVLDPFGGSGTTGEVAEQEGRNSILIELNPAYVALAKRRTSQIGLFAGVPK